MSQERDQIISHLLAACDTKDRIIAGLQKQLADIASTSAEQKVNGVEAHTNKV